MNNDELNIKKLDINMEDLKGNHFKESLNEILYNKPDPKTYLDLYSRKELENLNNLSLQKNFLDDTEKTEDDILYTQTRSYNKIYDLEEDLAFQQKLSEIKSNELDKLVKRAKHIIAKDNEMLVSNGDTLLINNFHYIKDTYGIQLISTEGLEHYVLDDDGVKYFPLRIEYNSNNKDNYNGTKQGIKGKKKLKAKQKRKINKQNRRNGR